MKSAVPSPSLPRHSGAENGAPHPFGSDDLEAGGMGGGVDRQVEIVGRSRMGAFAGSEQERRRRSGE